jgi:cytochrome b subunit of formate dehydrogenase
LKRLTLFSALIVFLLIFLMAHTFAQENGCLSCHGEKDLVKTDETGKEISLYVDQSVIEGSIHSGFQCVDCHQGVKSEIHMETPGPVDCGSCHQEESETYKESFHGQKYLEGNRDAPWCQDCHGSHDIRSTNDPQSITYRLNLPKMCGVCHQDPKIVKRYGFPAKESNKIYAQSVHGIAIEKKGLIEAAVCNDCHGSHTLQPASDPRSKLYKYNIPTTCGQCHSEAMQAYGESVHGKALAEKLPNAPVCTNCHGEHNILPPENKASTIYGANLSKITCPRCHSAEYLSDKYGVISQRKTPFLDSYHGVASQAGVTTVANCASCHGYHDILPSSDPKSSINKNNLDKTCGKCHPNAGENFAKGSVHPAVPSQQNRVVYWVTRFYIVMIAVVIGGMLLHNSVIMLKYIRDRYREAKSGLVIRFVTIEVLWHVLLMISFTTLALTGFAFRFPDSWWSSWMTHSPTAFAARGVAHRVAGVVFIGLFFFTFAYSIFTKRGWQQIKAKFPVLSDMRNVTQNILYSCGLSSREPLFDRYNYAEKAEYWALLWGGFVMILTGIPMWFENTFLGFMPKWLWDVFKTVHYYEAWLATLAILVWHMFYMIFDPETYPVNFTFLTGTMTEEQYMKRHPLDYEKMLARGERHKEEWLEEKPSESESEKE